MKKPLYSLTLITTMLSASLLATQVVAQGYEIPPIHHRIFDAVLNHQTAPMTSEHAMRAVNLRKY
ncbi:MAG: hypothetical protein ACO3R5_06845 [Pseudohongiellaceae bacterium]|jgi:hypothetical protein